MKLSEFNFLKRIFIFLFGLTNIFPSRINLYQYLVNYISSRIAQGDIWYKEMIILIRIFYILIPIATLIALYEVFRYGIRYNVYGLRDMFYK